MTDSNDGAPPPPYGQQPNPYGQAPFGTPGPQGWTPTGYGPPGPGVDPDKRPGTVTAAGVITLVFSGLTLVLAVLGAIGLAAARDDVIDEIRDEPGFDDVSNPDDIVTFLFVLVAVLAVWCLVSMILAVLTMRRSNIARILLVISAVVTALLSLLAITSLVSFVTLAAAVTVIVLLFVGRSGEWFARKGTQPQLPIGTTQPWG